MDNEYTWEFNRINQNPFENGMKLIHFSDYDWILRTSFVVRTMLSAESTLRNIILLIILTHYIIIREMERPGFESQRR